MYCIIQKQNMKRDPDIPSRAYKNAFWEPYYPGCDRFRLNGDMIKRERKEKYRIILNDSFRFDGILNKRQWHIVTLNYYDIADHYFESIEYKHDFNIMWIWEGAIEGRIKKRFPHAPRDHMAKCLEAIQKKLAPIAESVVRSYQRTEEYRVKLSNLEMKRERAKQEKARSFHGFNRRFHRFNSSQQGTNSATKPMLSAEEKKLAEQLIKEGYRRMAQKHHPDVGGDTEVMKILNSLKEKLMTNY